MAIILSLLLSLIWLALCVALLVFYFKKGNRTEDKVKEVPKSAGGVDNSYDKGKDSGKVIKLEKARGFKITVDPKLFNQAIVFETDDEGGVHIRSMVTTIINTSVVAEGYNGEVREEDKKAFWEQELSELGSSMKEMV